MTALKHLLRFCSVEGVPFIVTTSSTLAILIGLTTLLSKAASAFSLHDIVPAPASLTPNVAAMFTLVGLALWSFLIRTSDRWRSFVVRGIGLAIVLVAMVAVANELFAEWEPHNGPTRYNRLRAAVAGPLEPATAAAFVMLGSAIFWLPAKGIWPRRAAQCLLLATLVVCAIAAARSFYGTETTYAIDPYTSIPLTTAVILILLSVGMLYARRDFELMVPIRSHRMGGVLARTSLPGIAASPLMLGWFFLKGEQMELYGFESAVAVHAVAMVAILARIIWYSARTLNEVDMQREHAHQRERDLQVLSDLDPLTGVLNRRSLRDRLDREWSRAQRGDHPISCIMIDIDFFKAINDTYGHMTGDSVLKMVAATLTQHCRPSDIVARFGGEEFCVIASETNLPGAFNLAERLRIALAEGRVNVAEGSVSVTGSFGVAQCQGSRDEFDTLIDRADQALITAKRAGRNRVVAAEQLDESRLANDPDVIQSPLA
jgi:diguanylate cyclase (GGDEF)-like protein